MFDLAKKKRAGTQKIREGGGTHYLGFAQNNTVFTPQLFNQLNGMHVRPFCFATRKTFCTNQATNKSILEERCVVLCVEEWGNIKSSSPLPILSLLDVLNNSQTLFMSETNLTVGNELASKHPDTDTKRKLQTAATESKKHVDPIRNS